METFLKSFSILDDVAVVRSNMFADSGITDRQDTKSVNVPNYESIVTNMRLGMRKSGFLSSPYETKELKSMSGKILNPVIMDIYKQGVSAHDSDIRNVIRYGYCKKGYDPKNKVHVLKEDLKEVSEEKKLKL